jgi:hypothetical protein
MSYFRLIFWFYLFKLIGVDRHLFAMSCIARKEIIKDILTKKGLSADVIEEAIHQEGAGYVTPQEIASRMPPIYTDIGWQTINHNILSTSTLGSETIETGGFGPVVADGYGIGYGVREARMGYNVSSFK